nr:hypothetical protein [Tanacetum cinerariifolium]
STDEPEFYNSNSLGFDQTQPPQFLVIHPPPQETSIEILPDQENAINYVQTFLRKFNRISFFETPKVLLLAWDRFFKIEDAFGNKQYKPKDIQEFELFNDVQNIHEELAEYINTPGWNRPAFYNNVDDDDEDYSIAITPDFLITDSLFMGDEHLDTIFEKDSDEFIKSSVEDLVPNPRIDEANCDFEKDIHLVERLLYDNSSPRPPKEFISDNSDNEIESFSPSPIPIKDNDSLMEEIDLSFTLDYLMPSGIEDDDYDSEMDILILEELLDNYSLSLSENKSYHFDIPSPSRPPAKPPDGNTGILNIKMMGDISDQKVPIPGLMITCVSNQEKSPDLSSHRGLKIFQPSAEFPMIINGKNTPILDVPLFHFYPL